MQERITLTNSIKLLNDNKVKEIVELLPSLSKEQIHYLTISVKNEIDIRKENYKYSKLEDKLNKIKETR